MCYNNSDHGFMPYINLLFVTLYGIITVVLSTDFRVQGIIVIGSFRHYRAIIGQIIINRSDDFKPLTIRNEGEQYYTSIIHFIEYFYQAIFKFKLSHNYNIDNGTLIF